jgi:hypothetical protein
MRFALLVLFDFGDLPWFLDAVPLGGVLLVVFGGKLQFLWAGGE